MIRSPRVSGPRLVPLLLMFCPRVTLWLSSTGLLLAGPTVFTLRLVGGISTPAKTHGISSSRAVALLLPLSRSPPPRLASPPPPLLFMWCAPPGVPRLPGVHHALRSFLRLLPPFRLLPSRPPPPRRLPPAPSSSRSMWCTPQGPPPAVLLLGGVATRLRSAVLLGRPGLQATCILRIWPRSLAV